MVNYNPDFSLFTLDFLFNIQCQIVEPKRMTQLMAIIKHQTESSSAPKE